MVEHVSPAGVSRDILEKNPKHRILFKADKTCFPSYADQTSDFKPECATCGNPAIGASFVSMQDHSLLGRTVGEVEFSCGCDGRKSFALTVANLFPGWRLLHEKAPGVWTIAHLSAEQKAQRCNPEV